MPRALSSGGGGGKVWVQAAWLCMRGLSYPMAVRTGMRMRTPRPELAGAWTGRNQRALEAGLMACGVASGKAASLVLFSVTHCISTSLGRRKEGREANGLRSGKRFLLAELVL